MNTRPVLYGLMGLVVLACAALLFLGLRHQSGASSATGTSPVQAGGPVSSPAAETSGDTGRQIQADEGLPFTVYDHTSSAGSPETGPETAAGLRLPEDVRLSDVSETKTVGGQTVLVFFDGSQLLVTPEVQARLPSDLQLRLGYSRENP